VIIFLVIFSFAALVLLVRTNLAEQQLRWRDHRVRFSPDVTFDFVRSALYFSAIVLALAWIAPSLGSNPQIRQLTRPVRAALDNVGEQLTELYPSVNRQQVGTSSFGSSLTLSGARNVGDRPVFQVESQVGRYWRAVAFDAYDGRAWKNTTKERAKFDAGELIPAADWGDRETITQTVTLMMPTGNVVFSPPDLRQVDTPLNALVRPLPAPPLPSDKGENGALEVTYALSSRKLEAFDSYTVVSNYVNPTERDLRNVGEAYPPQILERYLQLPDDFSPLIAQTAQEVAAGKTTVYDKAKAIETFLRGYTYNDAIPPPPKDQDPIEWFLYDIRQGYCDYYATAMAIMLRSLGIPARTASGYAEGTYSEEDGVFYVTERDAHTWVEVYFPGVGWVEFEPTAGESVLIRQSGEDALAANAAIGSESPDNPSPDQGETQASDSNPDAGVDNIPEDALLAGGEGAATNGWRRWLWIALTTLMLLAGLLALWWVRFADSAPLDFTPDAAPLLYERMVRWAERIGVLFGRGQTPYEQADVLSRSLPAGKPYIQEITDEYVYYRFSGRMQSADKENAVTEGAGDSQRVETFQARTVESWKALRAMFMKEWLRQKTHRKKRRKKDAYRLE
jgi:transglutaminase-like putative cysteine protease